ncbi:hypothetical protein QBC47DRAFT_451315 [Echria macrotheca]|uniref:Uncharacterized protein n=1 Tax=Echria macrotheca TaxID=438768 RepID=A0AAJ0FD24_9PEZI|nr:hypothetical protein QBC47DRAFT_451315 [Echria macrotheca]
MGAKMIDDNARAKHVETTPTDSGADASMSTTTGDEPVQAVPTREELPGLPRLNYNLWHHKTKLSIVAGLLILESSILPIALFYGLRFSDLRIGLIFAVITSFFGIVTGIEYGFRILKLTRKHDDNFRPLGTTSRWCFDYTHHTLGIGYFYMSALLIGASVPHTPPIRPLAMPVCLIVIQAGAQLVWHGWMHARHRPAPFRISSVPKGQRVRPLVYTLVEDIIAVDGNAGKEYRAALDARYAASAHFRRLLVQLNWFWAVGALVDGIGTLVVIWTVPEVVAYGIGWGSPLVFVTIWTVVTVLWVRRSLRNEKTWWVGGRRENWTEKYTA